MRNSILTARLAVCAAAMSALVGGAVAGCSSDSGTATDPRSVYLSLTLNHHSVALSVIQPYDTVQLVATPRDGFGNPLTGAPAVTYTASDSAVQVTADGKVTAKFPSSLTRVVVTMSVGNVTHADTVMLYVNAGPPDLTDFTLSTADPTDSLKMAAYGFGPVGGDTKQLAVFDDGTMLFIPVSYSVADPKVAIVDARAGLVSEVLPGTTTVYAETYAYGVEHRDSVTFTVTYPISAQVVIQEQTDAHGHKIMIFNPTDIVIQAYGNIQWYNSSRTMAADVVFDDPDVALESTVFPSGTGNIDAWTVDTTDFITIFFTSLKSRQFVTPGTYHYHSAQYGSTGSFTVKP